MSIEIDPLSSDNKNGPKEKRNAQNPVRLKRTDKELPSEKKLESKAQRVKETSEKISQSSDLKNQKQTTASETKKQENDALPAGKKANHEKVEKTSVGKNSKDERAAQREARREARKAKRQQRTAAREKRRKELDPYRKITNKERLVKTLEKSTLKKNSPPKDVLKTKTEDVKKEENALNRLKQAALKIKSKNNDEKKNDKTEPENKIKNILAKSIKSIGLDAKIYENIKFNIFNDKFKDIIHNLHQRDHTHFLRNAQHINYLNEKHNMSIIIDMNKKMDAAKNVGYIFTKLTQCDHEPDYSVTPIAPYKCKKCGEFFDSYQSDDNVTSFLSGDISKYINKNIEFKEKINNDSFNELLFEKEIKKNHKKNERSEKYIQKIKNRSKGINMRKELLREKLNQKLF